MLKLDEERRREAILLGRLSVRWSPASNSALFIPENPRITLSVIFGSIRIEAVLKRQVRVSPRGGIPSVGVSKPIFCRPRCRLPSMALRSWKGCYLSDNWVLSADLRENACRSCQKGPVFHGLLDLELHTMIKTILSNYPVIFRRIRIKKAGMIWLNHAALKCFILFSNDDAFEANHQIQW
jgi:hypothetical protein